MTQFVGDVFGRVSVQFTPETLDAFIEMLNTSDVRDHNGMRVRFSAEQRIPGDSIQLLATASTD